MQRLTLADISKAYAGIPALSGVSLSLEGGKVHALMGENGAGKSTLIRILAGLTRADAGTAEKDGRQVVLGSPEAAHAAGFRFIHQELDVVPWTSVAENILLGHPIPRRFGLAVDWRRLRARAREALDALGAGHIDVRARAGDLPTGEKMLMKIAAALVADPGASAELYVLDEPTAALTGEESELLFAVIERLKRQGAAVLYVSHRIDEVFRIADTITVLRDGNHVSTRPTAETSRGEVIREMTGRELADVYPSSSGTVGGAPVLRLQGVSTEDLSGLDFSLAPGEVLGVTGLAEAGQTRLLQLLMGLGRLRAGSAEFAGSPLPTDPAEAWARGVAYIPRERRGEALMLDLTVRSNIVLPHLGTYGALARRRAELRDAGEMARAVRLKSAGLDQPVGQLSGGNQQKVVFARALMGRPRLLLLDEPTRGVDVGAKHDIYTLVRELAAEGCAVILTSGDLPEILGMCDRILVLQDGQQAHLVPRGNLSAADLLELFYDHPQAGAA